MVGKQTRPHSSENNFKLDLRLLYRATALPQGSLLTQKLVSLSCLRAISSHEYHCFSRDFD